jgi:hypothetical protein
MPLDNTPARLKLYADQYRQAILKPCSRGQIDRTASSIRGDSHGAPASSYRGLASSLRCGALVILFGDTFPPILVRNSATRCTSDTVSKQLLKQELFRRMFLGAVRCKTEKIGLTIYSRLLRRGKSQRLQSRTQRAIGRDRSLLAQIPLRGIASGGCSGGCSYSTLVPFDAKRCREDCGGKVIDCN